MQLSADLNAKLERRSQFLLRYLDKHHLMPPQEVAEPVAKNYARMVSFLAGDTDFPKPKGLFLFGPTGCGKTTLVRAVKDCCSLHLRKQPVSDGLAYLNARRMCELYAADQYFVQSLRDRFTKKAVIIDDLGTERTTSHYGTLWGLEDYIEERYETWEDFGYPTLFTSNLQRPQDVLERYGERAMSRLVGMVTFVAYNHSDRRFQMRG